jgi:hypothetical protein
MPKPSETRLEARRHENYGAGGLKCFFKDMLLVLRCEVEISDRWCRGGILIWGSF